jgi:hypothetical protein
MSKLSAQSQKFYVEQSRMSSPGGHSRLFDDLPDSVEPLAALPAGLALHVYMAEAYGVKVPKSRAAEMHLRLVDEMLDRIVHADARSLNEVRPPEQRLAGVCTHFTLLLTSMLRAKGIAARARCGFATYFNPGYFEDHWVCEYWSAKEERWVRVDSQIDEVHRSKLTIDFDTLDVPAARFLSAGAAWKQCRMGRADPKKFGIHKGNMRGLWFIAGDLVRDVAALNKVEVLPWDVWGAMPGPDEALDELQLAYFDAVAELADEGTPLQVLRSALSEDDGLRVPHKVMNSLRNKMERLVRD